MEDRSLFKIKSLFLSTLFSWESSVGIFSHVKCLVWNRLVVGW